ncbi:SRPBCC family protein [Natrialbaceae archaeon GCM10025810]|uniref:SRPBCC family protein n=1 Tax=Halovalidus salilacus TaxID=3075124 RepID=UPI003611ED9D
MTQVRPVRTPSGRRLEVSHVVAAASEDAWDAIVDTHRWPDWSPLIEGVESSERRLEAGTVGRILVEPSFASGSVRLPFPRTSVWLPFEITDCSERNRRWSWTVAGLPGADHRVDHLAGGRTRCRIAFELPPAAVGYVPICLRALERLEDLLTDAD